MGLLLDISKIDRLDNADFENCRYHKVYVDSDVDVVINGNAVVMANGSEICIDICTLTSPTPEDVYLFGIRKYPNTNPIPPVVNICYILTEDVCYLLAEDSCKLRTEQP